MTKKDIIGNNMTKLLFLLIACPTFDRLRMKSWFKSDFSKKGFLMNNFREKSDMRKKKHLNILVIDDEEEIGDIFIKWLLLEGHRGKYVLTGKEAIDLVKRQYFDFVFLDIVMPGVSAIEVLRRIRAVSPRTRVVVMTGRLADSRFIDEMKERGAADFLQKPFEFEEIIGILK